MKVDLKYVIIIAIACLIAGGVLYPSKTIDERVRQTYQEKIDKLTTEKSTLQIEHALKEIAQFKQSLIKQEEINKKVSVLKIENRSLREKTKERWFKLIKPDGTIVEKRYRESDKQETSKIVTYIKEEFTRKVKSIENSWKRIHKEQVTKIKEQHSKEIAEKKEIIAKLDKHKVTKINERKFGLAVGMMSDRDYFSNISYDIAGPFFIDLQIESNGSDSNSAGIGIGIRF